MLVTVVVYCYVGDCIGIQCYVGYLKYPHRQGHIHELRRAPPSAPAQQSCTPKHIILN